MRISSVFSAFALVGATSGFSPVLAQNAMTGNKISSQAQFVCENLLSQGEKTLVVLDKNEGELLVLDECKTVMKSSALYGKGNGESVKENPSVTPAGVFALQEYAVSPKDYAGGRAFGFFNTAAGSYIIHPTYQGLQRQRRDERLATATPEDNAISFGCVNIPYDFYNQLSTYLKSKITIRHTAKGDFAGYPRFVVMPKTQDLTLTAKILGLSTPTIN